MFSQSVNKIILIGTKLIKGSMQGDDFRSAFYDIYYREINKYKLDNKEEKDIIYKLELFNEQISYYCSIQELRTTENQLIDEKQLVEYIKNLILTLNNYLKTHGGRSPVVLIPKGLSNKTINQLENIILNLNRLLNWKMEKKDLIKVVSEILEELHPNSDIERNIRETICQYLNKLEKEYAQDNQPNWFICWLLKNHPTLYVNLFPVKEDQLSKRDPFIETINELKDKLYCYLNPDISN